MLLLFIMLMSLERTNALIGYNCHHGGLNITTVSLVNVPPCSTDHTLNSKTNEIIQLIQLADNYPVHVYQCKVHVHRMITHCGMHSHSSTVSGFFFQYYRTITKADCENLHQTQSYRMGEILFDQIPFNQTQIRSAVLAGKGDYHGQCIGSSYSDVIGQWDNVVVQATISITLSDYEATANGDHIILRNGLTCSMVNDHCIDNEAGFITWTSSKLSNCDERNHLVLYEGVAEKVIMSDHHNTTSITSYFVESQDKVFGLRVNTYYKECQFQAFTTEHPKLIIVPKSEAGFYLKHSVLPTSSLDILTYMNAKFVYIEKSLQREMADIYQQLSLQRCELERKTIMNLLSLAVLSPEEFAYNYFNQPGYTAVTIGEVIHLTKFTAVDVVIRETPRCYNEIPVMYNNNTWFLTPKTRMLVKRGREVDCHPIVSPQFDLGEHGWYSFHAESKHQSITPNEMAPTPVSTWKTTSLSQLAKSGIYSYEETERMRERLMNPYEKQAVTNTLVRGVTLSTFDRQGISLTQLADSDFVQTMGEKLVHRMWGWFSFIGDVVSGLIGLYAVLKIMKFFVDSFIHGKALHEVYGFSWWLIASIWDSLTNYLLLRKPTRKTFDGDMDATPMIDIVVKPTDSVNPVIPPLYPDTPNIYPPLPPK